MITQLLYVEGKDYFFIGQLCKMKFPTPKGFTENSAKQFMKGGSGYPEILDRFLTGLDTPNLTNIGLIVDADFGKIEGRFSSILAALSQKLKRDLSKYRLHTEGVTIVEEGLPTIGIWLMPDNTQDGYLEYFVEQLIPNVDVILPLAKSAVADLMTKDYCKFTEVKQQKAIIYNWLAWQQSPGLPFGTALEAGFLSAEKASLQPFLNWIGRSFLF